VLGLAPSSTYVPCLLSSHLALSHLQNNVVIQWHNISFLKLSLNTIQTFAQSDTLGEISPIHLVIILVAMTLN
jgi:hypothetical protein